jgi:hypothetical protein
VVLAVVSIRVSTKDLQLVIAQAIATVEGILTTTIILRFIPEEVLMVPMFLQGVQVLEELPLVMRMQ